MVTTSKPIIGHGVYSIPDASRITGVHCNTIRRWLDPEEGIVIRAFAPEQQTISFNELMELHFIKMFRDAGVSLPTIRRAAQTAAKRFGTDYPFAVKKFDTDGRTIFATLRHETKNKELIEDLEKGQYVFCNIIRPFFRKLDYGSAEITRYWPMTKRRGVVLDPRRQFGRPIDFKSGIPTRTLFEAVKANKGQSVKAVSDWFGVPQKTVQAAVEFERSLN